MPGQRSLRVGVDIGGTFTDLIVARRRDGIVARRQGADHAATTRRGASRPCCARRSPSTGLDARRRRPRSSTAPRWSPTRSSSARAPAPRCWPPRASATRSRSAASTATTCTTSTWSCPRRSCRATCGSRCRARARRRHGRTARSTRTQRAPAGRRAGGRTASRRSRSASCTAYANPAHEQAAAGRRRARRRPGLRVSISSEVVPEIREYERTSTTLANVYVQGRVERLPRRLRDRLRRLGIGPALRMMLSTGGIATVETAAPVPDAAARVGPGRRRARRAPRSAGPPASRRPAVVRHGRHHRQALRDRGRPAAGQPRVRGRPRSPLQERLGPAGQDAGDRDDRDRRRRRLDRPRRRARAAHGRPGLRGRRPRAGLLRPRRHGADRHRRRPGARLPRPRLLPRRPDDARRRAAAAEAIARPRSPSRSGCRLEEAAWGIHQIVNENMANAARVHAIERGRDPRGLPLFAFGGAGPVHGFRRRARARRADADRARRRRRDGDASASWPRRWRSTSCARRPAPLDDGRLATASRRCSPRWRREGAEVLARSGVDADRSRTRREADMRYVGQGHEVRVPCPALADASRPCAPRSRRCTSALYGRARPGRRRARGHHLARAHARARRPTVAARAPPAPAAARRSKGERAGLYFPSGGYSRRRSTTATGSRPGARIEGPAIVEERESTLVVGPGAQRASTRTAAWHRPRGDGARDASIPSTRRGRLLEPAALGRSTSSRRADAHRLQHDRARVAGPGLRRLRRARPMIAQSHTGTPGPHQRDGHRHAPLPRRLPAGDARSPATC